MNLNKSTTLQYGVFLWVIAAIFYGLDYLQHTMPSVLIEPIAQSLHISYINIADIMSVYFPVYAISQIPAGYLIDRFGIRITLPIASVLVSTGLAIMLAHSVNCILIGRILIGIGSAFAFIGALKTTSLWLPDRLFPLMVGLIQAIGVVGGLVGQVFIEYLIARHGWSQALSYIVWFGLLWALVMLIFLRNKRSSTLNTKTKLPFSTLLAPLKDANLWKLTIYATLMVGAVMSTFAELYDVVFLQNTTHVSAQTAAWVSSYIFIGVAVGAPLNGLIAKQFKRPKTWLVISAALTLTTFISVTVIGFFQAPYQLFEALYFMLGFFVSSMLLAFTFVRAYYPEKLHAIIFAFVNTLIGLGGFVIPIAFGEIIKHLQLTLPQDNQLTISLFSLIIPLVIAAWLTTGIKNIRLNKNTERG